MAAIVDHWHFWPSDWEWDDPRRDGLERRFDVLEMDDGTFQILKAEDRRTYLTLGSRPIAKIVAQLWADKENCVERGWARRGDYVIFVGSGERQSQVELAKEFFDEFQIVRVKAVKLSGWSHQLLVEGCDEWLEGDMFAVVERTSSD